MAKSKSRKSTSKKNDPKPKSNISKPSKKPTSENSAIEKEGINLEGRDALFYPGSLKSLSNPYAHGLLKTWNVKLVSWNVNGLRASMKHDSLKYLLEEGADVVGLQETKCADIDIPVEAKLLKGYKQITSSAKRCGYAGTAVYTKLEPISISYGIGKAEHDEEGRVITVEYEKFIFVTAYVPNAGRGLVRLQYRQNSWDVDFTNYLKILDARKPIVVCGDLNVSHKEIDLANPKSNVKTAGFTPEERRGFDNMLKSVGLVDTFRHIYPERRHAYTFWSYMGRSRAKNIGWRLDYFLVSERLLPHVCNQELRSGVPGSDHCPIVLFLDV